MGKSVAYVHDLILAGTPLYVFDLETTGRKHKTDRVLSFSAIKVEYDKNGIGIVKDSKNIFINPGFHISEEISNINGIFDSTVENCPYESEIFGEIYAFFGEKPLLCGYNSINFDEKFMQQMYLRNIGKNFSPLYHIDVMKMAKEKLALTNYKLATVAHELGADIGLTFHKSIDDVYATYRSFDTLMPFYLQEEEKELLKVDVTSARYWEGPSYRLKRVYVSTQPYSKTYYDCYRKEWSSEDKEIDLTHVRNETFKLLGIHNEKDMIKKVKSHSRD